MKHTDVSSRLDGDNIRCVHHVEETDLERNRTRLSVGERPRLYRVLSAVSDFCAVRNARQVKLLCPEASTRPVGTQNSLSVKKITVVARGYLHPHTSVQPITNVGFPGRRTCTTAPVRRQSAEQCSTQIPGKLEILGLERLSFGATLTGSMGVFLWSNTKNAHLLGCPASAQSSRCACDIPRRDLWTQAPSVLTKALFLAFTDSAAGSPHLYDFGLFQRGRYLFNPGPNHWLRLSRPAQGKTRREGARTAFWTCPCKGTASPGVVRGHGRERERAQCPWEREKGKWNREESSASGGSCEWHAERPLRDVQINGTPEPNARPAEKREGEWMGRRWHAPLGDRDGGRTCCGGCGPPLALLGGGGGLGGQHTQRNTRDGSAGRGRRGGGGGRISLEAGGRKKKILVGEQRSRSLWPVALPFSGGVTVTIQSVA
ncbi:hypothetical protein DFH09DRAFT_1091751 [Mycena vulgaris]|nr:hypothetical protein DFH09DRAFT_1091751 [Mycena vulgaris]